MYLDNLDVDWEREEKRERKRKKRESIKVSQQEELTISIWDVYK